MGSGLMYTCNKCKRKYSVQLGIGMRFPEVYRKTLAAIEKGEYGSKWQELYRENSYAAVDAESVMLICDNCGNWKSDKDLSLYAPNDVEHIKAKEYGEKTVRDLGYVPYVTKWELDEAYHLIKGYVHTCDKCNAVMRKVDSYDDVPHMLPCPRCGTKNEKEPDLMMWD